MNSHEINLEIFETFIRLSIPVNLKNQICVPECFFQFPSKTLALSVIDTLTSRL